MTRDLLLNLFCRLMEAAIIAGFVFFALACLLLGSSR